MYSRVKLILLEDHSNVSVKIADKDMQVRRAYSVVRYLKLNSRTIYALCLMNYE